jgi:hypothetical protein
MVHTEKWNLMTALEDKLRAYTKPSSEVQPIRLKEVRSRSDQHQGTCELYVTGMDDALGGHYYTSRKTTGEMTFTEWSTQRYGDAATALAAANFGKPKPFGASGWSGSYVGRGPRV